MTRINKYGEHEEAARIGDEVTVTYAGTVTAVNDFSLKVGGDWLGLRSGLVEVVERAKPPGVPGQRPVPVFVEGELVKHPHGHIYVSLGVPDSDYDGRQLFRVVRLTSGSTPPKEDLYNVQFSDDTLRKLVIVTV